MRGNTKKRACHSALQREHSTLKRNVTRARDRWYNESDYLARWTFACLTKEAFNLQVKIIWMNSFKLEIFKVLNFEFFQV